MNYHRPPLPEVRVGSGDILSPHGALRAYTVFLTAEPRRGSTLVLSSLVIVADVPRWRNIFSIRNRPHLPEVRVGVVGIVSPHVALRAYTVLLTAEPRRGSTLVSSSLVTVSDAHLMVHLLLYQRRPHLPEVRVGRCDILSPHGALRAYTVFLTAEPRRGSSRVLSSSLSGTERTSPRCECEW